MKMILNVLTRSLILYTRPQFHGRLFLAWHRTSKLSVNESYVSEKYVVEMTPNSRGINDKKATGAWLDFSPAKAKTTTAVDIMRSGGVEEDNWEGEGLLSEVEEDEDGRFSPAKNLFSEEEA